MGKGTAVAAVGGNAVLAAVYAAVAWGSLHAFATLNASASPVWPPTGVAIAALMLWGVRFWPGVFLGAFVANLVVQGTFWTATTIAAGNTMEAILAAYVVGRWGRGVEVFDRTRHVPVFLAAALGAPLVSATVGVTTLHVAGLLGDAAFHAVWTTWWLGDAAGAVLVAPLVVLSARWETAARGDRPRGRLWEGALLIGLVVGLSAVVFLRRGLAGPTPLPLAFTILPVVAWAAMRFGSHGAVVATFVSSVIAVYGTMRHVGPFADLGANTSLLFTQFFTVVTAASGLALGAIAHERAGAERHLRRALASEQRFRDMVESAPDATVIVDERGTIVLVNAQAERIFGYDRDEMVGRMIEMLVPQDVAAVHPANRDRFMADPRPRLMGTRVDLSGRRKDGSEFPVEISLGAIGSEAGLLVAASVRDLTERQRLAGAASTRTS